MTKPPLPFNDKRHQPWVDTQEQEDLGNEAFVDSELAEVFDRYAAALDSGDQIAAEAILAEYPEITDEFREPLRGLYLLGRAAQQEKLRTAESNPGSMRLGDFELQDEIGRGGMGIVYAANQISLQRRVALKVLPFTAVLDPRQVARFQNEAQAAASLHHPNIVPVYGVGCERGMHYYSMQLIEGQTLSQLIEQFRGNDQRNQPAAPHVETVDDLSTIHSIESKKYVQQIVEIGATVAGAIDFAHEHGIVHRDIKPSNLLLDHTGKIWVADFGLARGRGDSNLTSQGDQIGTLRYMSPEQAAGRNNQVDYRTDIYSLGVTLYELLTLQPAFSASDRLLLLAAIENREPTSLRSRNSLISVDLETVINKAIAKDPRERYSSAKDFAEDLLRTLHGKQVQAKRKTVLDRCIKSISKRKKVFAGLAVGLIAMALISTVVATVFYNQRQRERIAADHARFYLQQAHKTVDRFGNILTDELVSIPGATRLRGKLLSEAIGYYEDFLAYAADTAEMKFEQAHAHSQLGGLYERAGNDEKAIAHYGSSVEQFNSLKDQTHARFEQGICLDQLGLLLKRRGEFEESSAAFKEAFTIFDSLEVASDHPDSVTVNAAQTLSNLGSLNWSQGKLSNAAEYFEEAIALLAPFTESNRNNLALQCAYHKINGNYVSVLIESDELRAEQILKSSLLSLESANESIRSRGLTSDSELVRENLAHMADMKNNLATLLCQESKFDTAEKLANEAIDHWQSRLDLQAFELDAAERLATAYNTLGEIHWRSEEAGLGESSFEAAEKLLMQVANLVPHRPETLSRLGGVFHNRSLLARRQANYKNAKQRIDLAIKFQGKAIELAPANKRYQKLLEIHRLASVAIYDDPVRAEVKSEPNLSSLIPTLHSEHETK